MAFSFWEYLFFFLEIFTFLCYANDVIDDVIGGPTKTVQHSIKLGTKNVHHKKNRLTPTMLLPWQHARLQSLSVKNRISPFAIF